MLAVIGVISSLFFSIQGILPVWFRLGSALSRRKIAIFADDKFNEIKELLTFSGMFREKNIEKIDRNSLGKAEHFSFYIVDYAAFAEQMPEILDKKRDTDALIVYAPPQSIDRDMMQKIDATRNSVIVNFRGRLLNDVLSSMITTSFKS